MDDGEEQSQSEVSSKPHAPIRGLTAAPATAATAVPAPPADGRVRVIAPRSRARRVPGGISVSQEVAEQSAVGEVMVQSLIRSQLRLALVVSIGFIAALIIGALAIRFVPVLGTWAILGIPTPWLILGVGAYPVIGACAWLYVRAATKNENRYRDLVEEK